MSRTTEAAGAGGGGMVANSTSRMTPGRRGKTKWISDQFERIVFELNARDAATFREETVCESPELAVCDERVRPSSLPSGLAGEPGGCQRQILELMG